MFGNSQKKRPQDIILGRIFNSKVIDLVEFGATEHQAIGLVKSFEYHTKPVLIFQGDHFDYNDSLKKVKNIFIDFFSSQHYQEINILEMNRVIVFSATSETSIRMEQYEVPSISEALAYTDELKPNKIGPCMTLAL